MSDLNKDLRLAVDTGRVTFGHREVLRSISSGSAMAVVIANKGKQDTVGDIRHLCNIANIRIIGFNGDSLELGALCGRPYSVNALAILEAGNSDVLKEEYS